MCLYGGATQPQPAELKRLLVDKMNKWDNEDCRLWREQLFATWNKGSEETWMSSNELEEGNPRQGKKARAHREKRDKKTTTAEIKEDNDN